MNTHIVTTPFGRRPMTLGLISSQLIAKDLPQEAVVHKWHVFNDVREAREALGLTDRALAILSALLTFHPETMLGGEGDLVAFPSNEQLISRANGISPATLRRHLANLVNQGVILRRDSPNGKRFARKGEGGRVEQAFGFDLAPLVARAGEFKALAAAAAADRKALRLARERVSLCRRDIAKMIQAGVEEGVPGDWKAYRQAYDAILSRLPRSASLPVLQEIGNELDRLWGDVHNTLEIFVKTQKKNANESHFERHIQNSKPESPSENEYGHQLKEEATSAVMSSLPVERDRKEMPLGIVLQACPNITWVVADGKIRTWHELAGAAEAARPQLGISPSAWADATAVLGVGEAAVTLAAIYQRADQIKSPGGYLRSLVERARDGKFSTWPMVMALLRARLAEGANLVS